MPMLFVRVNTEHLHDAATLMGRIGEAALAESSPVGKALARTVQTTGSIFRAKDEGRAARNYIAGFVAKGKSIVLHLDEAQTVGRAEGPVLKKLHTTGIGVPCVVLMTGLSHTAGRVGSLDGLSRLSDNAIVNMGAMSEGECGESTSRMLTALHVDGDPEEQGRMAKLVTVLSYGWPQHLHCAQVAMCRELLRADGVMKGVDAGRVRMESDQRRENYYRQRLSGTALSARGGTLAAAVVKRVMAERPGDEVTLADICGEETRRLGLDGNENFKVAPVQVASLLLERGVLAFTPDHRYDVAIPSMARWLGISADGS